jgi:hypothetical protein
MVKTEHRGVGLLASTGRTLKGLHEPSGDTKIPAAFLDFKSVREA